MNVHTFVSTIYVRYFEIKIFKIISESAGLVVVVCTVRVHVMPVVAAVAVRCAG